MRSGNEARPTFSQPQDGVCNYPSDGSACLWLHVGYQILHEAVASRQTPGISLRQLPALPTLLFRPLQMENVQGDLRRQWLVEHVLCVLSQLATESLDQDKDLPCCE